MTFTAYLTPHTKKEISCVSAGPLFMYHSPSLEIGCSGSSGDLFLPSFTTLSVTGPAMR